MKAAKRQLELTKIDTGANSLARKTINELSKIARSKGIMPKGDKRKKQTWIDAIRSARSAESELKVLKLAA